MDLSTQSDITYDQISARAHHLWEQSGRIDGHETEHWLQAERELKSERTYGNEGAVEIGKNTGKRTKRAEES